MYSSVGLFLAGVALRPMIPAPPERRRIAAGQTPSRAVVLREVVLAAVVLGATAWMTGAEPPGE